MSETPQFGDQAPVCSVSQASGVRSHLRTVGSTVEVGGEKDGRTRGDRGSVGGVMGNVFVTGVPGGPSSTLPQALGGSGSYKGLPTVPHPAPGRHESAPCPPPGLRSLFLLPGGTDVHISRRPTPVREDPPTRR